MAPYDYCGTLCATMTFSPRSRGTAVIAALGIAFFTRGVVLAQSTPEPSPTPAATTPDASTGGFDVSKLTPEQQAALRLAIIKTSQNPVGNITAIPFQNNFNYGFGPYTRFQYNLNVQPVIPFMLGPKMNLIARTIIPVLNQPSGAPPAVCAAFGCGSTLGPPRRTSGQFHSAGAWRRRSKPVAN
jgi:hypothetical protein